MGPDYARLMAQDLEQIEAALTGLWEADLRCANLQEAMDYSLLSGGKRLRPVLTLETCRMCGGDPEKALPFAAAIEMTHAYSLVHDDLPAMDNDALRRGRPTNHMVYGEATAILAGDGLLTAAFSRLIQADLPAEQLVQAVECLARGAGPAGMVGGQALDMAGEGHSLTLEELEQLQNLKTGALISAAAELGCIAAGSTLKQKEQVCQYAAALGRAFQVRDDMLDVTSSEQALGKPVGSDLANEKSTFVTALGLEGCAALVEQLTRQAVEALDGFADPGFHIWLAQTLARREK